MKLALAGDTMLGLTAAFGPPSEDSGWVRSAADPPLEVRSVSWGRLHALFQQDPNPTFRAWTYESPPDQGGPDLATTAGVQLGDTAGTFEASAVQPTSVGAAGTSSRCTNDNGGQVCAYFDPPFYGLGDDVPPASSRIVGLYAGTPTSLL